MTRSSLFYLSCLLFLPILSRAAVIHVPADQSTIGEAFAVAQAGDTILVAAGDHPITETVWVRVAGVTLLGETGDPADVRLVCSDAGIVVDLREFTMEAVTMTGGGMDLEDADVTIRHCVITQSPGAGIVQIMGHLQMEDSSVTGCASHGLVIYGYIEMKSCTADILRTTVSDNGGQGIRFISAAATVDHCRITGNGAAGVYHGMWGGSPYSWGWTVYLDYCVVRDNLGPPVVTDGNSIALHCCDLGEGDAVGSDVSFADDDCGTPVETLSWGNLKVRYR